MGLSLGMKANISDCFLLPENLSLFYCCSLDSGVNPNTILALGNVCRNSGWGEEYTNIPPVLQNTPQTPLAVLVWDLCWSSWMSLPLKHNYWTKMSIYVKKKRGGGRGGGVEGFGEMDVNFSELKREQTSQLVQIKAGIFQWASGNWASGER